MELAGVAGLAVIVFASTNIDDIVVLLLFFTDRSLRPRDVIVGQYLGVGALVAVSIIGATIAMLIPEDWIGLLGIVPIVIGVGKLWDVKRRAEQDSLSSMGCHSRPGAPSGILSVSAVTAANGGDNIGIYVPLFATSTLSNIIVFVIVFVIMLAVWCGIAHWLVHQSAAGVHIQRYGHRILPFILIVLGLYILITRTALV